MYYEIINNRPADSLQPLKLMPASSELESHLTSTDMAGTLRKGRISQKTASSVLCPSGRPVQQGMPPTPSTSSSSADDMKRCASSKTSHTSGSNLKLKFNKNIGGRWRLTSNSSSSSPDHDSNDVYSFPFHYSDPTPSNNNTSKTSALKTLSTTSSLSPIPEKHLSADIAKRPMQNDHDLFSERPSKVSKVLPVSEFPAAEEATAGPSKSDKNSVSKSAIKFRDSASSLLFHTGLVPVEQHSISRTSIGANNFSMQRILQQY